MGEFSLGHWLVVLVVIVLLFGVRRLPELGTGLGQAIGNFRKAYRGGLEPPARSEPLDKPEETKREVSQNNS
jgi:sec-independent protein translocase protein TatA